MKTFSLGIILLLISEAAIGQENSFLPFQRKPGAGIASSIPIGDVLDQGISQERKEELGRIYTFISDSIATDPRNGRLFLERAEARIELRALRGALEDLEKARALGHRTLACYFDLGLVNAALGQQSVAMAYFRICLKHDAQQALIHYYMGVTLLYLHRGTTEENCLEAIQYFSESIRLDNRLRDAWILRACALQRLGKYEEAILDYSEALGFAPGAPALMRMMGQAKLHTH